MQKSEGTLLPKFAHSFKESLDREKSLSLRTQCRDFFFASQTKNNFLPVSYYHSIRFFSTEEEEGKKDIKVKRAKKHPWKRRRGEKKCSFLSSKQKHTNSSFFSKIKICRQRKERHMASSHIFFSKRLFFLGGGRRKKKFLLAVVDKRDELRKKKRLSWSQKYRLCGTAKPAQVGISRETVGRSLSTTFLRVGLYYWLPIGNIWISSPWTTCDGWMTDHAKRCCTILISPKPESEEEKKHPRHPSTNPLPVYGDKLIIVKGKSAPPTWHDRGSKPFFGGGLLRPTEHPLHPPTLWTGRWDRNKVA